jgi:Protein of unknown function (DUF3486)
MNTPLNPIPFPESPAAPIPPLDPPLPPEPSSRRKGKVAHLPRAVRDQINILMRDGETYPEIIRQLGPAGAHLIPQNLSRWFAGGHQDWLREQQRVDIIRFKQEFATDLCSELDGPKIHQATLQVAATNLCQLLVDLDPVAMRESLEENPDKYTRLLNAIARLNDGALKCERLRADDAERQAKISASKAPADKLGISDESLKLAEEKLNLL